MIPFLLFTPAHGSAAGGVIANPAYGTITAYSIGSSSASAQAAFEVRPDGSFSKSGTGYPSGGGSWYVPSQAGVGAGYEVRMTTIHTGGSTGVVANGAGDWQPLSNSRLLTISSSRYTSGTSTANYNVIVEIRPAGGGGVLSSASFSVAVTAQVQASGGGGGGSCPAANMWLGPGLMAREVAEGQRIDGVTGDAPESKVRLQVLHDKVSRQPCYRIVTSAGAACVLSESTPFTLRDGSTKYAGEMLGELVLRDDGAGGLVWDEVSQCHPVGEMDVVKISVGGHSLLAGEHPGMRIVSHNQQKE